jgi:hypothetical protein
MAISAVGGQTFNLMDEKMTLTLWFELRKWCGSSTVVMQQQQWEQKLQVPSFSFLAEFTVGLKQPLVLVGQVVSFQSPSTLDAWANDQKNV